MILDSDITSILGLLLKYVSVNVVDADGKTYMRNQREDSTNDAEVGFTLGSVRLFRDGYTDERACCCNVQELSGHLERKACVLKSSALSTNQLFI